MAKEVQVIIRFKEAVTKASTDFLTAHDAEVKHVFGSINAVSAKIHADKIGLLKADPSVEYVEIDQEAHILGFPGEIIHERQKRALAAGQTIPWGVSKIRAQEVWAAGNRGAGIKGCIIDTGIEYNHPDLKENYKGGYNAITKTNDPLDDNGHGSHVAGIAAAKDNDFGVVGVAPEMDIYAVKALDLNGSGSYSNIIASIQWAIDNGMHLINMSFGGTSYSKALEDICNAAYNSGMLLVAAAGNQGGDGSEDKVTYPARFDSVMAVAATDQNDQRASFSSAGPEVEVSAPGVSIPSTVPTSNVKYSDPSGYKSLSGTSMASPHAFGTASVVKKSNANLTNADVRKILADASVDLGTPGRDVFYGSGRIDAKAAVDNNPPQPPVLTKIAVSPATISVIIGGSQQFKATALDQNNNPMASIEISWTVDNPAVGNVDPPSAITGPDGNALTTFTALAEGTARVTASSGDVSGSTNVTVTQPPPQPVLTTITVSPATASVIVGETQQFKATALDQNNNPMASIEISWTVDNPAVGSVNPPSAITGPDGNALTTFTALAEGTARVTASNGNVSGSTDVTVTMPPQPVLTTITVSPATASVIVGGTQQFKATALDQNNNPMASIEISWTVDNPAVGNVAPPSAITGPDGNALTTFTALAAGTAAVNASNGNVSGSATVTVTTPPPAEKKFTVYPLGISSKPSGILVLRRTSGDLTSDEACKKVCDMMKKM